MKKSAGTERLRNAGVLRRIKDERIILYTAQWRKANWIGHILHRNCLLKHVIEGKVEGMERRRIRRKQLLGDLKEGRGYWNLKEEALDRTVWRTRFGRSYGPVVRETSWWRWLIGKPQTTEPFDELVKDHVTLQLRLDSPQPRERVTVPYYE
jgi:hypothetical protein